jgi:hypothetical protein
MVLTISPEGATMGARYRFEESDIRLHRMAFNYAWQQPAMRFVDADAFAEWYVGVYSGGQHDPEDETVIAKAFCEWRDR